MKNKSLHVLIDSGSDKSFINNIWTDNDQALNIVNPIALITSTCTIKTKCSYKLKFKLEDSSVIEIRVKLPRRLDKKLIGSLGYEMIIRLDPMIKLGLLIANCKPQTCKLYYKPCIVLTDAVITRF